MAGKLTDDQVQQVRLDHLRAQLFARLWEDRAGYLQWLGATDPAEIMERALSTKEELCRFATIFLLGMNTVVTILRQQGESLLEVEGLEPGGEDLDGMQDRDAHARRQADFDRIEDGDSELGTQNSELPEGDL